MTIKPEHVDPKEMELRQNKDFNASLDMVGEGAPIYHLEKEDPEDEKEESH